MNGRESAISSREGSELRTELRTSVYARHARLKLERGETNALAIDEALALARARQIAIVEFVVTETTAYAFPLDGERLGPHVQALVLPIARNGADRARGGIRPVDHES
jgi:hypothetical protein